MHVDWMAAMAAVIARHCLRCRGKDSEHWLPAAFQLLIDLLTRRFSDLLRCQWCPAWFLVAMMREWFIPRA